eukprot:14476065-Heterocapsa_arctica.AAC.1
MGQGRGRGLRIGGERPTTERSALHQHGAQRSIASRQGVPRGRRRAHPELGPEDHGDQDAG